MIPILDKVEHLTEEVKFKLQTWGGGGSKPSVNLDVSRKQSF